MNNVGVFGARLDSGGLGWQTRNIVRMLKPGKILAIDSSSFNKGSIQDHTRYEGFVVTTISRWPTNRDCNWFTKQGISHIFMCETPYNLALYGYARRLGIKTYCQVNYEFLDAAVNHYIPHPDKYLMPSHWMLEEMQQKYGDKVEYLPPPVFPSDFKNARNKNFERTGRRRFLHIMGKVSSKDRNGTFSLLDALKHSKEDFELVIRCQHEIPEYMGYSDDNRITWDLRNVPDQNDMYEDFDMMMLPRRFAGLCLPMNEALVAGLPVIMTDISPNNNVLPKDWLVPSKVTDKLMTRMELDVYSADAVYLGKMLDWFATCSTHDMNLMKMEAFDIGCSNFSADTLKPKYLELMENA